MAFPVLCPLPSMSSSRAAQYPSPPPVGIKLVEKKRWSVKRVLLLLLTAVAGYDFCNEFALGGGTKAAPVQIAPASKQHTSWRDRSLALLRLKSTRKAPPLPPPTTATAAPRTASTTAIAAAAAATPTPSRPAPAAPVPITSVPVVRTVALLPSPHRSSVSTSHSWQAGAQSASIQRAATHSSSRGPSQQVYSNDSVAEWESDEEKEPSVLSSTRYPAAIHLHTGLSSPPFIQPTRSWQSPDAFTQLVEA